MIKEKFGTRLMSKKEVAQINEKLCKVLCHNRCRDSIDVRVGNRARFLGMIRKRLPRGKSYLESLSLAWSSRRVVSSAYCCRFSLWSLNGWIVFFSVAITFGKA